MAVQYFAALLMKNSSYASKCFGFAGLGFVFVRGPSVLLRPKAGRQRNWRCWCRVALAL